MKYQTVAKCILVAAICCILFPLPAARAAETTAADTVTAAADIVGVWLIVEDGEPVEKVRIYECDDVYCGEIVWVKPSATDSGPALDLKNKDKDLRDRPLLGLEVLKNYKFDGKDTWRGGKFYAHRKGKTVSPTLTLIDPDHLRIRVKILFVKKSFVWERVADLEPDGNADADEMDAGKADKDETDTE